MLARAGPLPFLSTRCHVTSSSIATLLWTRVNQRRRYSARQSQASNLPTRTKRPPTNFAFAFDIDGVLLRSSTPIPGASKTLTYLQNQHIPFILLTNGGGKTESTRASDMSRILSLPTPLTSHNLIQSHTPIADFLDHHPSGGSQRHAFAADATILVLGGDGDACRLVAESYGYTNVVVPGDLVTAYPDIWPFSAVFRNYYSGFARPLPKAINPSLSSFSSTASASSGDDSLKIDAIFIFHDPRDWALDTQILIDVLLSERGVLGTVSKMNGDERLPNHGFQRDGQPPLYFCNADLVWAAGWHLPRLGQGGFKQAVEGVWDAVTGGRAELESTVLGKPEGWIFGLADKRLNGTVADDGRSEVREEKRLPARNGHGHGHGKGRAGLEKIYMVGDNPESDIKGANKFESANGTEWVSMLVKTGVYNEGEEEEDQEEKKEAKYNRQHNQNPTPDVVVQDVRAAVRWALKDSHWEGEPLD